MIDKIIIPPPAKQLINGIRSMGYTFSTALADIIDNSITAGAKQIDVNFDPLDKNPYLCILDNGDGMSRKDLENAMTFGTNRDERVESMADLGRFGLGLKTASLSQCTELIVVSKKNGSISALSYNLEIINKTNEWAVKIFNDDEILSLPEFSRFDKYYSGTMVIWRNFDKIESMTNAFEYTFRKIIDDAIKHISLIFHMFYLDIDILFNGVKVPKRDPFLTGAHGRTQKGRKTIVGRSGAEINITPYSLPYLKTLTSEEKSLLGDPKSVHDEQGFYIYRNRRLIIWGTWLKLGFRSELNKLARVKVEIPSVLDKEWALDVKKSSATIPEYIKEQIRIAVEDSILRSTRVFRHKGLKEQHNTYPVWLRTNDRKNNTVSYQINVENNTIIKNLYESLDEKQKKLFDEILKQIESFLPRHQLHIDQIDELEFLTTSESENLVNLESNLIEVIMNFPESTRINVLSSLINEEAYLPLKSRIEDIKEKLK